MNNLQYSAGERNRYFYGKLMTARDFEDEQTYFNDKRRLGNRALHGAREAVGDDHGRSVRDTVGELLEPRECDSEPLNLLVAGAHRPVGDVAALREARVPERLHVVDARELAPEAAHVVQGDAVALLVRVPAVHPEAEAPEAPRPVEPIERGGALPLDPLPELAREPRDVASLHGVLPSSSETIVPQGMMRGTTLRNSTSGLRLVFDRR